MSSGAQNQVKLEPTEPTRKPTGFITHYIDFSIHAYASPASVYRDPFGQPDEVPSSHAALHPFTVAVLPGIRPFVTCIQDRYRNPDLSRILFFHEGSMDEMETRQPGCGREPSLRLQPGGFDGNGKSANGGTKGASRTETLPSILPCRRARSDEEQGRQRKAVASKRQDETGWLFDTFLTTQTLDAREKKWTVRGALEAVAVLKSRADLHMEKGSSRQILQQRKLSHGTCR